LFGSLKGEIIPACFLTISLIYIMDWRNRIERTPDVLGGKPVVKGTRLSFAFVASLLANGWTVSELLTEYPTLSSEDVQACLRYVESLSGRSE